MPRYFIELKYDGTRYHGWQIQQNATGVQQVLNEAMGVIFKRPVATLGCGRTDTGVHARQFFVHFDLDETLDDLQNLVHRLNGLLPNDIAVMRVFPVRFDLHARFDATGRTYRYYIYTSKDPFLKGRAHWIHFQPDREAMQKAADLLLDYTDFSCFSKNRTQVKTNICHITHADMYAENGMVVFRISADRFLRGMVRAIVGTLLQVGEGKMDMEGFRSVIENKSRKNAGASVAPYGLYLDEVTYDSFL